MHQSGRTTADVARPLRAKKSARSWGDINLTLNRMVRDGAIGGFRTNLSGPDRTCGVTIAVTPVAGDDGDAVRQHIHDTLEAMVEGITVTIEEPAAV